MSIQIGYIDNDGHPRLTIRISGTDPNNFIEEDALIDTGFTGFLMLPQAKAFGLGSSLSAQGTIR
jgi:predicted aspartyl protease